MEPESSQNYEPPHVPAIIPLPPPLRPLPDAPDPPLIFHPNERVQTNVQRDMLEALDLGGHAGLAWYFYQGGNGRRERADAQQLGSWKLIESDLQEKRYHVYLQIISLPICIQRSLIKNTLSYDIEHDEEVREFHSLHMGLCSEMDIHYNQPKRKRAMGEGFLTVTEAALIPIAVEKYLSLDARSNAGARNFDMHLSPPESIHKWDETKRRWMRNESHRSRTVLQAWAGTIAENATAAMNDNDLAHTPQRRTPMEIGWSENMLTQARQYADSQNTNFLFGYFNTWSRHILETFEKPSQGCIFRIWESDQYLAQVSEVLATLECSAHFTEGGFNSTAAGTFYVAPKGDESYDLARSEVFTRRPHVKDALEADKALLENFKSTYAALSPQRQRESAEHLEGLRQTIGTLQVEVDRIEDHIGQMTLQRRANQQKRYQALDKSKQEDELASNMRLISDRLDEARAKKEDQVRTA